MTRSPLSFSAGWRLFHDHLFHVDLRAIGETDEVNAFCQAFNIDLFSALGFAVGHHLSHAVVG